MPGMLRLGEADLLHLLTFTLPNGLFKLSTGFLRACAYARILILLIQDSELKTHLFSVVYKLEYEQWGATIRAMGGTLRHRKRDELQRFLVSY